jgi:hypothetical protein
MPPSRQLEVVDKLKFFLPCKVHFSNELESLTNNPFSILPAALSEDGVLWSNGMTEIVCVDKFFPRRRGLGASWKTYQPPFSLNTGTPDANENRNPLLPKDLWKAYPLSKRWTPDE